MVNLVGDRSFRVTHRSNDDKDFIMEECMGLNSTLPIIIIASSSFFIEKHLPEIRRHSDLYKEEIEEKCV